MIFKNVSRRNNSKIFTLNKRIFEENPKAKYLKQLTKTGKLKRKEKENE